MRILILGAGAVGLTVAAKLSAHAEVYAVCRKRYADAIAADGFVMTGIWGEGTYHFPCGESAPAGPWDYIIISTKSAATREICERYRHLFGDAEVVSLQNGIGNEEVIREYTSHDIYPIAADFKSETGLIQTPLEDLLAKSDFISLHCNLTKDNYHLLDEKEFESMKDHVYIINTARGPLINEKILSEYLENGKIAGAALDVFEEEPLPGDSQLRKYENCIFGSHNSSDTLEAVMRVNERTISNLITGLDRE